MEKRTKERKRWLVKMRGRERNENRPKDSEIHEKVNGGDSEIQGNINGEKNEGEKKLVSKDERKGREKQCKGNEETKENEKWRKYEGKKWKFKSKEKCWTVTKKEEWKRGERNEKK